MTKGQFPIAEVGLARTLGVARGVLRNIRRNLLKNGEHYTTDGKSIQYTPEAAQFIAKKTGASLPSDGESTAVAQMVNEKPAPVAFIVLKLVVNPRIVIARAKSDLNGPDVVVRVSSNVNFRKGMELQAADHGEGWNLVGRIPRYPGKW